MTSLEKALRGEARKAVRSLMIVPTNTQAVMSRLEQRFGRPEIAIQSLVEIARKTPSLKEGKLSMLVDYCNSMITVNVSNLVTTIQTLQQPMYLENPQLLQELVEKLPDVLKLQWGPRAMEIGGRGNLQNFADWIEQMSSAASMVTIPKVTYKERRDENLFAADDDLHETTASNAVVPVRQPTTSNRACPCCDTIGHFVTACDKFKKKSVQDRYELAKKKILCFRCLRGGYSLGSCQSKNICREDGCGRRHHTLLHGPPKPMEPASQKKDFRDFNATMINICSPALLRIVCVTLYGPTGEMTVNALLDEGSTVTLIADDVANELGLTGALDPLRIHWTDGRVQSDNSSRKVDVIIGPVAAREKYKLRKVRTVKQPQLRNQRTNLDEVVKMYPNLQQTKFKYLPGQCPVMLIGQAHIHLYVARKVIENKEEEPMLTRTKLGWVMHGPGGGLEGDESTFSCVHESDDDILHNLVKESWSMESLGVKQIVSIRSRDVIAEKLMESVTKRVDGRWQTGLLWRNEPVVLPSSRTVAERRLKQIERKLSRNENIKQQYSDKINRYVAKGYAKKLTMEELAVKSDKEWYLPHFDTQHPNKPGKIRIVFDAASRSNGVSLNDHLLTGPDLLISLPGVLLRFRQKRVAVSGDITEMFHQTRIRNEDCPAQRFLWRDKDEKQPSVYEVQVMMFGSACSPYCAQYVKNRNTLEFEKEYPAAAKAIIYSHYMDDWLESLDTEDEAIQLVRQVTEVHSRGRMEIGKWISNSKPLLEEILGNNIANKATKNLAEWSGIQTERALGLQWIPDEDLFTFRVNLARAGEGIATGERIPTKRAVLRLMMLVWDPLGFIGHYLVKSRILLQQIRIGKIGWDDEIPSSLHESWKSWISSLPTLANIRVPRCYSSYASSSSDVSLHVFCDSSEAAGCSVCYLRVLEENEVAVSFVMSKSRVAPLKSCSIPRLELTAALIDSRMGKFILLELNIQVHRVYYWTDSMTVLKWIHSEARRFQTFVAGRVGEIQENTEVCQWRWVPTAHNPADDGTREGKADLDGDSQWWQGPSFMKLDIDNWPKESNKAVDVLDDDYGRSLSL